MTTLSETVVCELRARRGVLEVELSALTARLDLVDSAPRVNGHHAVARRPKGSGRQLGECAQAIVAFIDKQEHRCVDSAVLRRELGKSLGAAGDAKSISNALTRLKSKGMVTRKGTMWTLKATA